MGASTPRWTLARANAATSPVATHLPSWRQRPTGTSVYRIPIRVAVRIATGRDGIAQPPQLPRSSTPNGRGRSTVASRTASRTARNDPTNTTRWRKRRSTSNASRVPQRSAPTMPAEPVEATIASIRPVIPGKRSPASHRTTASSQTVTATPRLRLAGPKMTLASATRTTAAAAHHTPVGWMLRGKGGGLPVGRRRRPDRLRSSAPGRVEPLLPRGTCRGMPSMRSSWDQAACQSIAAVASQPRRSCEAVCATRCQSVIPEGAGTVKSLRRRSLGVPAFPS